MHDFPSLLPSTFAQAKPFRKSQQNANINYRRGWVFAMMQVEHNQSIFGEGLEGGWKMAKKVLLKEENVVCIWGTVGEGK